jgi:hypothetical protein
MGTAAPGVRPVVTLRDLCERAKLGDASKALLKDEHTSRQFLELLVGKELFPDATRFLAFSLPKREAVGWGCLCVRHSLGTEDPSQISKTQVAAERWVANPDEGNRQAAKAAVAEDGPESPSDLLALAAFYSGGSVVAPNLDPVPPPDHMTPQFVAGAVMIAAVKNQPEKAAEKYRVFLQKGMALMARIKPGPPSSR